MPILLLFLAVAAAGTALFFRFYKMEPESYDNEAVRAAKVAFNLQELKWSKIASAVAIIFAVLSLLATAVVTVEAGKVGIVTRFGAVTGREIGPGVSLKAPFPVEQVTIMDTRVDKTEAESTAASNDLQDVNGKLAVNWRLERGKVSGIYQEVGILFKEKLLEPAIQESFKATTAQYSAQDLIKKRSEVNQKTTQLLNERLERYGIIIESVNIVDLRFSEEFTKAIEQSQVAQQQVVRAQNEVERVKKEAEAAIEKAKGEAEAQREQAQSITEDYLRLKAVEKWDGKLPTTMAGDGVIFNIPAR